MSGISLVRVCIGGLRAGRPALCLADTYPHLALAGVVGGCCDLGSFFWKEVAI